MNYFAHGCECLDQPYVLAGTAVPDWLSVVNRRVRARAKLADPWIGHADPVLSGVAQGVVLHHQQDAWFHQTRAFAELSLQFTVQIRERLPDTNGFRHSFLGHILVEILLDAALIEQDQKRLDHYYETLQDIDPTAVAEAVDQMATGRAERLPEMISMFCRDRFLYDYLDDAKLLKRLNRVMRRVKLPELPASMMTFLAEARLPVGRRRDELLDHRPAPQQKENSE